MKRCLCCVLLLCVICCACTGQGLWGMFQTQTDITQTDVLQPVTQSLLQVESAPSSVSKEEASSKADASTVQNSSTTSQKSVSTSSKSSKTTSKNTASVASSKPSKPAVVQKPDTLQTKIVNYIQRPTYASVQQECQQLAQAYPELIAVETIGTSVQGRNLTLLKVGTGVAKACIVGGFHAREHITVSYVMRCVEEFCAAYQSESGKYGSFDMVNLLDSYTLYIVPLANPDGLEILAGRDAPEVKITYRKNSSGKLTTLSDYKANANGVNLNKNFPFLWDQVNTKRNSPDPENYKGTAAASEPETQALMALCEANDFMWLFSVHVRGDCVYWSDATNRSVGQSASMANRLKTQYGFYRCNTSTDVNGYGGGFENWFRETYKRPGFCLELMPLTISISSRSDTNHKYFSSSVRWNTTKYVFPDMMIYGYIWD